MINFFYAVRQVFKLRGLNIIKLLSLTLGIMIGGVFVSYVAYQKSFDRDLPEVDRTMFLELNWQIGVEKFNPRENYRLAMAVHGPYLMDKIPEIESATRFLNPYTMEVRRGKLAQNKMKMTAIKVDSLIFDVLDFGVLRGDPHKVFAAWDVAFISERAAQTLFPNSDPIGREFFVDDKVITVGGLYKTPPVNSSFRKVDIMVKGRFSSSFDGGDSYNTFFRVKPGVTPEQLEAKVRAVLDPIHKNNKEGGDNITFYVKPMTEYSTPPWEPFDTSVILLGLAIMVIVVSGFNFALMSISSLVSRSKEVGVHKASGATARGVFMLVIWETLIYIVLSVGMATMFAFILQPFFENITAPFSEIFELQHLWSVGVMLLFTAVVAGVIPGVIFARIPVTQVFQRFTANRLWWKQGLMFVQFGLAIFTVSMLIVMGLQYRKLSTSSLGYDVDKLAFAGFKCPLAKQATLRTEIARLPQVEAVTLASDIPFGGLSGGYIINTKTNQDICSARWFISDTNFYKTYGVDVLAGRLSYDSTGNYAVNQKLLQMAGMTDDGLDATLNHPIGAITRNFHVTSLQLEQQPLLHELADTHKWYSYIIVRMNDAMSRPARRAVERKIDEVCGTTETELYVLGPLIEDGYTVERSFRDGVFVTAVVMIVIALMGLVGYIFTDLRRRTREIAVRKVYGSTASKIIILISRRVMWVTLASTVVAIPAAWWAGNFALSFYATRTPLYWWIFLLGTLVVLTIVLLTVAALTYRTASANPARSLKSE